MAKADRKSLGLERGLATSERQRGSFLTEMTLVLPLLFILFIGTVDLSVGMLTYLKISRVAYEVARYGSSLPNMNASYDPTLSICDQNYPASPLSTVATRGVKILDQSMLYFTDPLLVDYRVSYQLSSRQIHVCVTVPWTSIAPGLLEALGAGNLGGSIRATATAPYLFSS